MPTRTFLLSTDNIAKYVLGRFSQLSRNRKDAEVKWLQNYQAVHRINEGYWESDKTNDTWRSEFFFSHILQKVNAAFSIISDAMLTGGQYPFLMKLAHGYENPDMAERFKDRLAMADQIEREQLQATGAEREYLRILKSVLIYGLGWGKKIFKTVERRVWEEIPVGGGIDSSTLMNDQGSWCAVDISREIPAIIQRSVWTIYWDMECESIEDTDAILERDNIDAYSLRQMADLPGYIPGSIEKVLSRHSQTHENISTEYDKPLLSELSERRRGLILNEFWGRVPRRIVEGYFDGTGEYVDVENEFTMKEDAGDDVEVMAVVVGDTTVRVLETRRKDRPYLMIPCDEDIDRAYPDGAADKGRDVQKTLNETIRLFFDNEKLAGNGMWVGKPENLVGDFRKIYPGKFVALSENVKTVAEAIAVLAPPNVGHVLIPMINMLLQFGDDETGIPKMSQGAQDPLAKNATAFEISTRAERALKYTGSIIRNIDEYLIEPQINWIHECNMTDPEYSGLLGPFVAQATGFNSFQNRQTRLVTLMSLLSMAINDPSKILASVTKMVPLVKAIYRLSDEDGDEFLKSEEEIQETMERDRLEQAQQVAQIETQKAQTQRELAQANKTRLESEALANQPEEPPANVLEMV